MGSVQKNTAQRQLGIKSQVTKIAPYFCVMLVACGGRDFDTYKISGEPEAKSAQDATLRAAKSENHEARDIEDWWPIYAADYGESRLHVCDIITGRWRGAQPHRPWMSKVTGDFQQRSAALEERSRAHARHLMAAHDANRCETDERMVCWNDPTRVEGCSHGPNNTFTWLKSRVHCTLVAD